MKTLALVLAGSTSYAVFRFFRRLGIFGLLILGTLDSSFLFFPFGNDLLLIALISSRRGSLMWIAYVLASVVGSVLGVFLIDLIMRKAGEAGLERFVSRRQIDRMKAKLENKAEVTVFLATVIPPPFPFTPVIMTASALQMPRRKLLVTVFLGRLIRFTLEAVLAIYFGRKVIAYLNSKVVVYVVYGLIAIAIVGSVMSLSKWMKSKTDKTRQQGPPITFPTKPPNSI